ncbi:hypothetical protein AAG570_007734 [Ranatra chinensis]|uniref:Uncharacterized protein n=1 Tax=Ranatra chinensis TaxID=642074 RepID=A0ABD0XX24_9HEMI
MRTYFAFSFPHESSAEKMAFLTKRYDGLSGNLPPELDPSEVRLDELRKRGIDKQPTSVQHLTWPKRLQHGTLLTEHVTADFLARVVGSNDERLGDCKDIVDSGEDFRLEGIAEDSIMRRTYRWRRCKVAPWSQLPTRGRSSSRRIRGHPPVKDLTGIWWDKDEKKPNVWRGQGERHAAGGGVDGPRRPGPNFTGDRLYCAGDRFPSIPSVAQSSPRPLGNTTEAALRAQMAPHPNHSNMSAPPGCFNTTMFVNPSERHSGSRELQDRAEVLKPISILFRTNIIEKLNSVILKTFASPTADTRFVRSSSFYYRDNRREMLNRGVSVSRERQTAHRQDLVASFGWDIVTHPPNFPDLGALRVSPMKEILVGKSFSNDEKVKETVEKL